jgi:type I restriction enzyme R subunit
VQAVQTLSRLNRTPPGKEGTFVLDFVNELEEIRRSFQPYYEQTLVAEQADPHQLYDLQAKLDAAQVYYLSEVDAFCKVFYTPKAKQTRHDQAEMYRSLDPAIERFRALEDDAREQFRDALRAYVHLYQFLAQVMGFIDEDLEQRYTFGRFLLARLPHPAREGPLKLDDEVGLRYYRVQKVSEGTIRLAEAGGGYVKGPTEVGTGMAHGD